MNKTGGAIRNILYTIFFAFIAVYFIAPQYIGMEESSKKTRATISKVFNDVGNLFSFQDATPKKYGEGSRESDPFKENARKYRKK